MKSKGNDPMKKQNSASKFNFGTFLEGQKLEQMLFFHFVRVSMLLRAPGTGKAKNPDFQKAALTFEPLPSIAPGLMLSEKRPTDLGSLG